MSDVSRKMATGTEPGLDDIWKALVSYRAGDRRNVAIVGDPYSGKSAVLEEVIAGCGGDARWIDLTAAVTSIDGLLPEDRAGEIVAIDDCQFLHMRKIGGFDTLERFLDTVVTAKQLFITVWNKFSWDYLKHIFVMEDHFPVTVTVQPADAARIRAIIAAKYDLGNTRFDFNHKGHSTQAGSRVRRLKIGSFTLPVPMIRRNVITLSQAIEGAGTEDAVFRQIADLSYGNIGVALALWSRAYQSGTVKVSDLVVPDYDTDLGFDEAFVLSSILMMKRITRDELLEIAAERLKIDRILYMLTERGLIHATRGGYGIEPLALHSIVKSLKKSRLVA